MNRFLMHPLRAILALAFISAQLHLLAQPFAWVAPIEGAAARGMAMVCDPDGNVYVCGNVNGLADFDPGPGEAFNTNNGGSNGDNYIVKYGPDGQYIWHVSVGGSGTEIPKCLKLDGQGHLLMAGRFDSYFDWDPGVDTTAFPPAGSTDGFVAMYDTSGQFHWVQRIGGSGHDETYGVDLDEVGNVYVTGWMSNTVRFGMGPDAITIVNTTSGWDSYIAKLDPSGNFIWAKGIQGPGAQNARSIACGGAGDIYVHGSFSGTTDFDPSGNEFPLTSAGGNDAFLCKYDTAGALAWAQAFGSTGNEGAEAVITDRQGHLFITGSYQDSITFTLANGTRTLVAVGSSFNSNNYFAKLDTAGTTLWANSVQGNNHFDGVSDIGIDSTGNVIITGAYFADPMDMDPGPGIYELVPGLANDLYLGKYTPDGQLTWALSIAAGEVFDTANGVCTDPEGNVFVTGGFGYWGIFNPLQPSDSIFTPNGMNGFTAKYGADLTTAVGPDLRSAEPLLLYPNPTDGSVHMPMGDEIMYGRMVVTDRNGRVVRVWGGRIPDRFSTLEWAEGTYHVALYTEQRVRHSQLVVAH
ncbi:MAG: SBBP repeat-containing protein [Flavobacteriales bacterium]|jgi:WD40 repeat protein|nr:SBBP repeat-containing protein [Flavobacteriales bacterium]